MRELGLLVGAADVRARWAGETFSHDNGPAAVSVLRDALLCALRARQEARRHDDDPAAGPDTDPMATLKDAVALSAEHPHFALLRTAITTTDCLSFDRMSSAELETLKRELETLVDRLRSDVDLRSDGHLLALRIARTAGAALVAVVALAFIGQRLFAPRDLALGKPVTMSTQHPGTPDPAGLVDGITSGSYGAHTQVGAPGTPWMVVDLQAEHNIRRIVVYNRGDRNFDDGLPLVVSTSLDGRDYKEVARRAEHFGNGDSSAPPWTIESRVRGRYVRIEGRWYIALNELEVF
jgi:hypothetical protein